ncbi:MAG: class I mannose-6-phosphate isomerase [Devosia sp.]
MTLEIASEHIMRKPWGRTDLRPWSELGHDGSPIGELWFQRADPTAPEPALLLKLLFTDERLSVQVHPDDALARQVGLPHGKTEAWYVLEATPNAELALGLKRNLTASQLRTSIEDGTIPDFVHWQSIAAGQARLVPAGTIHAIGAGLVIAEIQQRSDATFRMFDYGRARGLHLDGAVAAAHAGPAPLQASPVRLSDARLVMATSPYFVLEQVDLAANSRWEINAESETWLLLLGGDAKFDLLGVRSGEALFIENQRVGLRAGADGLKCLIAYAASEALPDLLRSRNGEDTDAMIARFPEWGKEPAFEHSAPRPWSGRS